MKKIRICVSAEGVTHEKPDFGILKTYSVQAVKNELTLLSDVVARLCGVRGREIEVCLAEPEPSDHLFKFVIFSTETSERYSLNASEFKEEFLLASTGLQLVSFMIWLPPRSCFQESLAIYQS